MRAFRSSDRSDIWINGGYFIFRPEIFDYMREGEELVLEPFNRLIADDQLMAYRHESFWRSMDTLRDRQILEDLVEQGEMPWRKARGSQHEARDASSSDHAQPESGLSRNAPLRVLCLGAHSDDIEIGCGGTILNWIERGIALDVHWVRIQRRRAARG